MPLTTPREDQRDENLWHDRDCCDGVLCRSARAGFRSIASASASASAYVVRPPAAPQTTLRVSWSLLWPVKRGIEIQQPLQESK